MNTNNKKKDAKTPEKKNNRFMRFIKSDSSIARLLSFISLLLFYYYGFSFHFDTPCGEGIFWLSLISGTLGFCFCLSSLVDYSMYPKCKECDRAIFQVNEISGSGVELFGFDLLWSLFPVLIIFCIGLLFFNAPLFSLHLIFIYFLATILFVKLKKPEKSRESKKNVELIKK